MNKPNIRVLNGIVNVKDANLIYNEEQQTYHLIHYDTEIAIIKKDKTIIKLLKCTPTSTKAIYKLTDYLEIDRNTVKANLKPYYNFVKYKNNMEIDQ